MPTELLPDQSAALDQAELDALRPTLARIARVAKTLFGAPLADVNLFRGEEIWRASGARGQDAMRDPASELVRQGHEVIWVEDLTKDERFSSHDAVAGAPYLRFYAGAPIDLESGFTVGALAVYGLKIRERDENLSSRLADLAAVVGHECDRILAQSERAQLLDQLKRQEERLEAAVEAANLHVFDFDFVEQTLTKTGIEETFFDRPLEWIDIANRKNLFVHPDDRERKAAHDSQIMQSAGLLTPIEWRVNREDGKDLWVQASAKMFRDEAGRPLRLVGSLQNITDRKMGEKVLAEAKAFAEAANVAKSAFLATMSHEIRTPLNGVLGMAQAMAADELTPVQRERLDVVRQSGESLLAILNDLLDFSKIEAGKMELEMIEFDLAEIARGAYGTFTPLAENKGISFRLDIEAASGTYRGDPTRIRQILYNLISNALKFTEEGEIGVVASFDGANLLLTVSDTGIGMTAETLDGLFAKFSQADASMTRKFGGTGLGLAICKELAVLMGGDVSAQSRPGEGSSFTVTLPMERLGAASQVKPKAAARATGEIDLKILAAEDNSVNQLVLKTLLGQIGLHPTIVENGALAVEAFEQGGWDLVLMDVQMPVMDGPTAVRHIRAYEAKTGQARTPIVALTANAMSHQVAEYIAAGMDGHLAKPIEAAKLFQVLSDVFDASEQETAQAQRA